MTSDVEISEVRRMRLMKEFWNYGITESRIHGDTERRIYGTEICWNNGNREIRNHGVNSEYKRKNE